MVKRYTITWREAQSAYYVSDPDWDGGEVVMAVDYDKLVAALQALADDFAVHAAKGTTPAIDDPTLVAAVELLAANRGGEPT